MEILEKFFLVISVKYASANLVSDIQENREQSEVQLVDFYKLFLHFFCKCIYLTVLPFIVYNIQYIIILMKLYTFSVIPRLPT